jgi:hypothetical protein
MDVIFRNYVLMVNVDSKHQMNIIDKTANL